MNQTDNSGKITYQNIFENKNILSTLFDNDPTGILIIDPDTHIIIDGNKSALEMIGLAKHELIGKVCHRFVCPAERGKCPICDLKQKVDRSERLLLRNNKSPIPILKTVVPINLNGKEYLLESFIDITERKQAEDALRENNSFLKALLNAIPAPVFFKDTEGRYIGINKAFTDFYGVDEQEMIGRSVFDIAPPELAKVYHEKDVELFQQQGEQFYEAQIKDYKGVFRDVTFHKAVFTDTEGRPRGLIGVILDVTDRKQAEQKVNQEIIRRRVLFEQAIDGIVVFDAELNVVEANKSFANMFGYAEDEIPLINITAWDIDSILQKVLKAQCPDLTIDSSAILETKLRSNNGKLIDVELSTSLVDLSGERQLFCVFRDVTHRNQMVKALADRENRLRTLYATIPDLVWLKNVDGVYLSCNPMFERLFGAKECDIIGKTDYDFVDKATADLFRENDRKAMHLGRPSTNEEEVCFADDGHHAWLETIKTPMYDDNGSLVGILGIAHDITEHKKHEIAIKHSAEIQTVLREIVEAALLSSSLDELFAAVHQLVKKILPAQNFYISLLDEMSGNIVRPYCKDELNFIPNQRPVGGGLTEYIMRLGKVVHINSTDISQLRDSGEITVYLPPDSEFIAAPLRESQGKFLGAITLYSIGNTRFKAEDKELLSIIAAQVSMAIERKRAEGELSHHLLQLKSSWNQTIRLLSDTAEVRDPYTAGHQKRVAALSAAIGKSMGCFSEEFLQGLTMAAMLHDIGKITVPSEILSKPGKISPVEFELIKTHSQAGYDLLKKAELPWNIAEIIHQHHERIDGSGYPRGLKGQDILIEARIIAVADVVEAMSAHRPYRPGLGVDVALQEIETKAGQLYDQNVVNHCLYLFRERSFSFEEGLPD